MGNYKLNRNAVYSACKKDSLQRVLVMYIHTIKKLK